MDHPKRSPQRERLNPYLEELLRPAPRTVFRNLPTLTDGALALVVASRRFRGVRHIG